MPFESLRQHLMSNNTDWGAKPPQQGYLQTISQSGSAAPEDPTGPHLPDATTASSMEYVVTQQTRPKTFVSSKGWTVGGLLERGKSRFKRVPRVSASAPLPELLAAINHHEESGIPLIIEGWHEHPQWPEDMFSIDWFREHGQQDATARNIHDWSDRDITLSSLIEKQRAISTSVVHDETERLYGKDAHCPDDWTKWFNEANVIPSKLLPEGPNNLLQCLPQSERVETLMCYLGIGDTFTPCHKDLCASSGQNIMCYTENFGSSFWFMTASSDAPAVTDYFHHLGQELDLETHVITVEELEEAPFTTYVDEQRLGDMVLVPPRSCHQVVNHGGITIKASWSRMTLDGLATAFYHELPIYRRVCRKEIYRVKYTIYHALLKCTQNLQKYTPPSSSEAHHSRIPVSASRDDLPTSSGSELTNKLRLKKELRQLINLFDDVLGEEYSKDHNQLFQMAAPLSFSDESSEGSATPPTTQDGISRVICDFCGTDIFQSFFECRKCVAAPGSGSEAASDEGLAICPSCYVEGRSCRCEIMHPMQHRPFSELLHDRNIAVKVLQHSELEGGSTQTLEMMDEGNILSKTTLGIFNAAYTMYQYRQELSHTRRPDANSRSCFISTKQGRHPVPRAFQLYCKRCHSGLCFEHILDLGVHSAEAILVYQSDPSQGVWHDHHKDKTILSQAPKAREAEKAGVRCDVRHKMALVAQNFDTCMPLNSQFTKPGWYDKFIQSPNIPTANSAKQAIEEPMDDSSIPPSPLSPLSSLPTTPSMPLFDLPESDDESSDEERALSLETGEHLSVRPTTFMADGMSVELASVQKKRKRCVLDYILMPSLSDVARLASTPTTTSQAPRAKEKETDRARARETDGRLPIDIQTSSGPSSVPPRARRNLSSPSSPKELRAKALSRRIIISTSRETTPVDIAAASFVSGSVEENEHPKKKARFKSGSLERSGVALSCPVISSATARGGHHPNDRDSRGRPTALTGRHAEPPRSPEKGFVQSPINPSFSIRNVSQTTMRPKHRNGESNADKRFERLEKRLECKDTLIKSLQEDVKKLQGQLQDRSHQDKVHSSHRLKIQRDFSSFRQTTEQQESSAQKQLLSLRADLDSLRAQMAEKSQTNISPTTSTHIVVQADSLSRYLEFEKSTAAITYKTKGIPFARPNKPQNRQFIPQSDSFQGQHPVQFPQQPRNDNGGISEKLQLQDHPISSPHTIPSDYNHAYINGNRIDSSGESSQHSFHPTNFRHDNDSWTPPASQHRQNYIQPNGNRFNTGGAPQPSGSGRYYRDQGERRSQGQTPPSYRPLPHRSHNYDNDNTPGKAPGPFFHPNQGGNWHRDPVAGPSRPHRPGPATLHKRQTKPWKNWGRPQERTISSPNNIDLLPVSPSRGDQEPEFSAGSTGVPEHAMSPPSADEIEEHLREQTPSIHWEDGYDQTEAEPDPVRPTVCDGFFKEIPAGARTPTERSIPATTPGDINHAADHMESNPWAS